MLGNDPMTDRYCRFSRDPVTGAYERHWIQYADNTFEPVRRVGELSRKYEGERTNFHWWRLRKPAAWRPRHDGCGFSWNHHFGEENKPGEWGGKSPLERRAGDAPYFLELDTAPNGRIASRTERIDGRRETWEFQYDDEGRLTSVIGDTGWCEDFDYDDRGRRSADYAVGREPFARTYAYTDDDRLLSVEDTRFEHDDNGFRSARIHGGRTTRYRYSSDYRLLGAALPDGRQVVYNHDANGRRAAKLVSGTEEERYEWLDFLRLGRFRDKANDWRFHYDDDRVPHAATVNGAEYRLHFDQVGSLKAVVSPTGNVVKSIQYGPFGNILWDSDPALRVPLGFAGGLSDPDTGLVRFGWRDYDPDTGRWTAPDPLGDAGGDPDWYGYCLDDPVNGVDPVGLWTNEYGEEIPKGRPITEYFPGLGTPFSALGTRKNVQKGLRDKKADYSDNNDWKMRQSLEEEANNFGFWDAVLGTYRFKTDDSAVEHYVDKAKSKIGKK